MSWKHTTLLTTLLLVAAAAGIEAAVTKEKQVEKAFHVVTNTPGINTINYPTCRTWTSDGKSLFVESSRPRPDGTSRKGERQLLKIDIADGKVTHLATLEAEDTAKYGKAHRIISSHYHADYAPKADILVYYDMTAHNMYLLDLKTGRREHILHEPYGTIGDPPSISMDGTRVVYYVIHPQIETSHFTSILSVIYVLDIDPVALKAVGKPRVVLAYPGRKGPKFEENEFDHVFVDHPQINPTNNDHISYAHEFSRCEVDGSLLKTRLWQVMADGSNNRPFCIQQPGEGHTHEVFGPKGKLIYWVSRGYVYSADFTSGEKRLVFDGSKYGGCHVAISPDEKWLALDLFLAGKDEYGNQNGGLMLVNIATGEHRILCKFSLRGHPGHPHPNFSPDGSKIAFVFADGRDIQVGYVDVPERKVSQ